MHNDVKVEITAIKVMQKYSAQWRATELCVSHRYDLLNKISRSKATVSP